MALWFRFSRGNRGQRRTISMENPVRRCLSLFPVLTRCWIALSRFIREERKSVTSVKLKTTIILKVS